MQLGAFPWHRGSLRQLPREYAPVLDSGGVLRAHLPSGAPVWIFGSHAAYRQLMTHPAVSADHSDPNYPALSSVKRSRAADGDRPVLGYSGLDGDEHTHHRRIVDWAFTEQRVAASAEALGAVVHRELNAALGNGQPADLAAEVSVRIAVRCILLYLGVPLAARASVGGVLAALAAPDLGLERRKVLGHRLRAVLTETGATAAGRSGSVWATLHHAYGAGPVFTEMVASLLIAGGETMARAICSGLLAIRGSDEAAERLSDTSAETAMTVNEILRICGVADLVSMRVAHADIEIMGHHIPSGDGLVGLSGLADRDPAMFPSPSSLDFHRASATVNTFGHGVHRCLGKHLAREVLGLTWRGLFHHDGQRRSVRVRWPDIGSRPLLYGPSILVLERADRHCASTIQASYPYRKRLPECPSEQVGGKQ
jgi:cytochrome P450